MPHRTQHIVAVYPGSFDPVTYGHLDVIRRAAPLFNELIVGVGTNPHKQPLFSPKERLDLLEPHLRTHPNVRAEVYAGLTIDFDTWTEPFASQHVCFRVDDATFDAVLARLRAEGVGFRSTPHGPFDHAVNPHGGGRLVYWDEPDGHVWELLTVSYARQA